MKYTPIALILAAVLSSCTENQPAQQETQQTQPLVNRPRGWDALANATPQYSANVNAAQQPGPAQRGDLSLGGVAIDPNARTAPVSNEPAIQIPADAKWTLYCASLKGADRFARAGQLKSYLVANTSWKNWYVVHGEADTTLFHGFYPSVERNEPGAGRAHADRKAIAEWIDPSTKGTQKEERPFALCFFTPITPADPAAPAEWNLANAPADCVWSLQLMAFHDNPKRKEAAVEAVRELRAKYPGQQFFYYHGESVSSVCVGAWPITALREQEQDGSSAYEAGVREEDAILVTNMQLPERYRKLKKITDDQGKTVKPFTQRIEVWDKSLQAAMDQFPIHSINYETKVRVVKGPDGKMREVPPPTFLVKIPREAPSVLSNTGQPAGINALVNPTGPSRQQSQPAGSGSLRRIDPNNR